MVGADGPLTVPASRLAGITARWAFGIRDTLPRSAFQ
jgi:hypothetical protein